ncbi:MAG TPA: tRNA (adenosine(37)-N6)-dimethylallyltransferase MiaA [Dehalococcoidales bacterium]|nr:MAG: tRNA (adenosine(37)-N6)-dimethylallyltransferase MiaA [Chloroflexi bacterium RBG_16_60_22]HJX13460.1 tRNA (adenosine(37)-N6)-dimethylallyltransferase MiaA [Dehalococcoidales bacterium]
MKRLIAIVGPTGVGKSRLALRLAGRFHGEIVSADSRQVYRHLDIGTAKPTPREMAAVPHHLIDIVNPDEDFSLARYQALAYHAISDIHRRQRLPFLVGGSGLYVRAVLEGWRVPGVLPDPQFRYNIEERAREIGVDGLYRELVSIDPEAAGKIDPRNVRRVVRALEVYAGTRQKFSRLGGKKAPDFDAHIIGLTADRAELYRRVDERVDAMMARGLVAEVEKLREMGYDFKLPAMSGIGYRQVGQYLAGGLTLDEAGRRMKTETHRFIRHQYAWFRLRDEKIHWYDVGRQDEAAIEEALADYLEKE